MTANDSGDQICVPSSKEGEEEEEEWSVSCSDDEKYSHNPLNKARTARNWEPPASVIADLYRRLDEKGILDLEWICPDRRSPTPPPQEIKHSEPKEETKERPMEPDEFDFDVPAPAAPSLVTPRRLIPGLAAQRQPKGSGQKRVASLKNVMSDIRRHQKLEAKIKSKTEPEPGPAKSVDPYSDMDF